MQPSSTRVSPAARLTRLFAEQGWPRTYAIAIVMGLFLSLMGAAGTDLLPIGQRIAYWLILMLGGTMISQALGWALDRYGRLKTWQEALIIIIAATPLICVLVWLVNAAFMRKALRPDYMPGLILPVLLITTVMAGLHLLLNREPLQSHVFTAPEPPVAPGEALRQKLPFKFRQAEIRALSAEDHYLRVHTSAGDTLILMRLSDAIRQLDGIEGSQVHRSWWVAKDAIADVRKSDGRFDLVLKDGISAPVSRTYQKALKATGWL